MTQQVRMKSNSWLDPYFDSGRLNVLQLMLTTRLEELLNELEIEVHKSRKMYSGCCPVHGGNNPGALNLYVDGTTVPGYWKCYTRNCHDTFKRTIIGFVRGVLSHQKFSWSNRPSGEQKMVSWREAVDWCCRFLKQDIRDIRVDYTELDKRRFAADVGTLTSQPEQSKNGFTRATVRKHLCVPADYFIKRGLSAEILDRYDVGLYPAQGKPLSNRAVVPIYDAEHLFVIGFTGRSIFEQCSRCQRWHHPEEDCPGRSDRIALARTAKWHNHQFNRESCLFNYWFAKKVIRETGVVLLVEGPGDAMKLAMAGIHNSLAMFGCDLSDAQQVILESSGAMNLVVLTDMDEAGAKSRDQLKKRLSRLFRLHFPKISAKDIGEMSLESIRKEIGGLSKC